MADESAEDVFYDIPADIGQAVVAAAVAVGQLFVVDAHQVQDGGVEIVDVDFVFHGVPAEFVGRAVGHAAFDAAAGEPHGETEGMMFAAIGAFGGGRAAEFAAPDDESIFEQAAGFQIFQQAGDGLVDGRAVVRQFFAEFAVLIPKLATGAISRLRVIDLNHADAAFGEAAGHQTLFAERLGDFFVEAVKFFSFGRFARNVEGFGRFGLHAEGEFEGFDARAQTAVFLARGGVEFVEVF